MPRLPELIQGFLLRDLRSLSLEIEAYPDDESVWAMPGVVPNSAGTLVLHICGNLQHYVGALLGGSGYVRDRDREFSARDLPRSFLLEQVGAAKRAVENTLPKVADAQLSEIFPETFRDHRVETADFLIQLAVHLGYHLGQINYHRRVVTSDPRGLGALAPDGLTTARPAAGSP